MRDDDHNLHEMTEEDLLSQVKEGELMKDLIGSPVGDELVKFLKQTYADYVSAAVRESQRYHSACMAIEQIMNFLGQRISAGEAAEKLLVDLAAGKVDEDY